MELVDNADGTLSVFTTMVDLGADDPVVATTRLLMANDPQLGFETGTGEASDRNTELLLAHPFAQAPTPTPTTTPTPTSSPTPGSPPAPAPQTGLPATGGGVGTLTVGGALLALGAAGMRALRDR